MTLLEESHRRKPKLPEPPKRKIPIIHDLNDDLEDSASLRTASSSSSANIAYASSRTSLGLDFDRRPYRRVLDHSEKALLPVATDISCLTGFTTGNIFETSNVSSKGFVEVHDHKMAHYIESAPRASEATYEDYEQIHLHSRRYRASGGSSTNSQTSGIVSKETSSLGKNAFNLKEKSARKTAIETVYYSSDGLTDKSTQSQRSTTNSLHLDHTESSSNNCKQLGRLVRLDENEASILELNLGQTESSMMPKLNETMSSPSESEEDSESEQTGTDSTSDEACTSLENLELDGERIVTPILDPEGQAMVERIMAEFWLIFNQSWSSNIRHHTGYSQRSEAPGGSTSYHNTSVPRAVQKKRQRIEDEEEDAGSDRNGHPPHKPSSSPDEPVEQLKFACPFRKYDPCHYSIYTHRSCALSHWPSIARVKEHLYRSHQMKLHCERCWQTFDKQEDLRAHRILDPTEICQVKAGHPPEGLTPEMEKKLRSRKKAHRNQTDEDRWREMYRLLFPDEDVPSPYFELLQEEAPSSPDSRDLAQYEEYARRELPRLVRASVLEVFSREMQPVEASLIANLVETIQECQARMFRSYSESMGHDQPGDAILDSMEDALPIPPLPHSVLFPSNQYRIDEENSMQTPANFLNAAFQQPPPFQSTGFEPGFQIHDLMHSLNDSHAVDASFSSSSEGLFTANGHGSEYTSTTVSSQSQATDNAGPPRKLDSQGDAMWQNWTDEMYRAD